MEKLPERWAVERTPENYKQVNEWANANLHCGPYFNEQGTVISDGYINCSLDNDEHELLTSDQFMRLLYNPWKQSQNLDGWVKNKDGLLPCPFCGKYPSIIQEDDFMHMDLGGWDSDVIIECCASMIERFGERGSVIVTADRAKLTAISRWNKRELPAPPIN